MSNESKEKPKLKPKPQARDLRETLQLIKKSEFTYSEAYEIVYAMIPISFYDVTNNLMPAIIQMVANENTEGVLRVLDLITSENENDWLDQWIVLKDYEGKNLFIIAAKMGPTSEKICEFILEKLDRFGGEALLKEQDNDGCTAAHYLYLHGSLLITAFPILQKVTQKDNKGYTPSEYLTIKNDMDVKRIAQSLGTNIMRSKDAHWSCVIDEHTAFICTEDKHRILAHPDNASFISLKGYKEKCFIDHEPEYVPLKKEEVHQLKAKYSALSKDTLDDMITQNRSRLKSKLGISNEKDKKNRDSSSSCSLSSASHHASNPASLAGSTVNEKIKEAHNYLKAKNYAQARNKFQILINYFQSAAKSTPKNEAFANYGLGWSLYNLGNLEEAVGYFRKASELNPGWSNYKSALSECEIARRDKSKEQGLAPSPDTLSN